MGARYELDYTWTMYGNGERYMNREFFENPTTNPDYSIGGFWFWNDQIIDEKTHEQLQMMKRIGANQPVLHARFGLENEYLSEDWFARVGFALDTAKKKRTENLALR